MDQRPFGRFRLPWLSAVTAPRPEPQPQPQPQATRPAVEIIAPPQSQRPPFRPPTGIAQALSPPPPAQLPQRTEPQPPSPPRANTDPQIIAQPASPSRGTSQSRASSVPPSPSRRTSQARASSVPPSPSHAAPQPTTTSLPPSPTRPTTQPQPTLLTVPQRLASSSRLATQITGQTSSLPSSPPRRTTASQTTSPAKGSQPPASQQEPKPAVSLLEAVEKVKQAEERNRDVEIIREGKMITSAKEAQTFKSEGKKKKEDHKKVTAGSGGEQIKTVSSTYPKPKKVIESPPKKADISSGEHVSLHKEIKDDITKFVHKLAIGQLKYATDEKPVSIVTIAGENRGASMHICSEPTRKDGSIHIHRGYKLNPDDSTGATTDGEEIAKGKKSNNPTKEPAKKAFINSNSQGINNSMVLESSVNEENPGVHLLLSQDPAEPIKPGDKPEPLETHKNEFSVTPAQKLTYNPTIRRRCLRGLFQESSDSDPDNPDKPR